MNKSRKKAIFDISLWVVISAVAVLVVIAVTMTRAHFQQQEASAVEIFVEKGETLIRSFEAGLQDAADEKSRVFNMQKLLIATAQQPDIDYIIITENRGNIIADSDPSMVGQKYGLVWILGKSHKAEKLGGDRQQTRRVQIRLKYIADFSPFSLILRMQKTTRKKSGKI